MAPLHEFYKLKPQALCSAYLSSAQDNLVSEEIYTVTLDAETFDPGSYFNVSTYKFVAPIAGFYLAIGSVGFKSIVAAKTYESFIRVNGSTKKLGIAHSSSVSSIGVPVSGILTLAATDEVILAARQNSGVDTVDLINSAGYTYLDIHFLSAS